MGVGEEFCSVELAFSSRACLWHAATGMVLGPAVVAPSTGEPSKYPLVFPRSEEEGEGSLEKA